MTENLLQKLEEKMMGLLTEVESLRQEVKHLNDENAALKTEKEQHIISVSNHEKKLRDLLSLLDAINVPEPQNTSQVSPTSLAVIKPVLEPAVAVEG